MGKVAWFACLLTLGEFVTVVSTVCETVLAHGNADPPLPDIQGVFSLLPGVLHNDQPKWINAGPTEEETGYIHAEDLNGFEWIVGHGTAWSWRARAAPAAPSEALPYQVTSSWTVRSSRDGWFSQGTVSEAFKVECEDTNNDEFWRSDGICEGQKTIEEGGTDTEEGANSGPGVPVPRIKRATENAADSSDVKDGDKVEASTQKDCLHKCREYDWCNVFTYSRYGCYLMSSACELIIHPEARGFTYGKTLVSTVQLNRPVYQSSVDTMWGGEPENAVDGNMIGSLSGGLALTLPETNPWWAVDLEKAYRVHSVVISNRRDCCQERIVGTRISVGSGSDVSATISSLSTGDQDSLALCTMVTQVGLRPRELHECVTHVVGQVVVVHKVTTRGMTDDVLQIAEVEVVVSTPGRFSNPLYPDRSTAYDSTFVCNVTLPSGVPLTLSDGDRDRLALQHVTHSMVWVDQDPTNRPDRYQDHSLTGRLYNVITQSGEPKCSDSLSEGEPMCVRALDGAESTVWSPEQPVVGHSIQTEFLFAYLLHGIQILQPYNSDGSIENITIHFSDNSFMSATLKQREEENTAYWDDVTIFPPVHSSHVKIDIESLYGTNADGFAEIEMYGEMDRGVEPYDGECSGSPVNMTLSDITKLTMCQNACFEHHNCSAFVWYFQGTRKEQCDLLSETCTNFVANDDAMTLNVIADSPQSGFYATDDECEDRFNYIYVRDYNDLSLQACAHHCRKFTACFRIIWCPDDDDCNRRCTLIQETCVRKSVARVNADSVVLILKEPASMRSAGYLGCATALEDAQVKESTDLIYGFYHPDPHLCKEYCRLKNYTTAALKGGFTSHTCGCLNNVDILHVGLQHGRGHGVNDLLDECVQRCATYPELNCGAYRYYSLYTASQQGSDSDCVSLTHNVNEAADNWRLVKTPCDFSLSTVCERDYDYCTENPCANGGTCVGHSNGFTCQCGSGYTGTHCQTDIDDCKNHKCENGDCIDGHMNYTCNCTLGYAGILCDEERDGCYQIECLNNGTCQSLMQDYNCDCASGYRGQHCEIDISECESWPCLNGGRCLDGPNHFTCICPPAYHGTTCEQEVNECASSPCENNATCEDLEGRYECQCSRGLNGDHCTEETNECDSSPCKNNATCTDLFDNFDCSCPEGLTGRFCEIDIDDCEPNPCENHGSCDDLLNATRCHCLAGWTGDTCHIYIGNPGEWATWSAWDTCSVSCGWGSRSRSRECVALFPELGEGHCSPGVSIEEQTCDLRTCPPVNGGWGAWSAVSACSTTCGPGIWEVERVCDTPAPQNGGQPCPEAPHTGWRLCNEHNCPIVSKPTEMCTAWSTWSACGATCGWGQKSRSRDCSVLTSAGNVTSSDVDTTTCYLHACASGRTCSQCESTYTPTSLTLSGCQNPGTCPVDKTLCSTVISKNEQGSFLLKKGCATEAECKSHLQKSMAYPCIDLFLTEYAQAVDDDVVRTWRDVNSTCTVCCYGDLCNHNLLPYRPTAYGYSSLAHHLKPVSAVYVLLIISAVHCCMTSW